MSQGFTNQSGITFPVPVSDGGTGRGSAVAYAPIVGGTTSSAPHQSVASPGIAGQVFTSNGSSALPSFQTLSIEGFNFQPEVYAATTANLAATYNNGTAGVGATLTNSGAQAAFAVDGVTVTSGLRVLVKDQTTEAQNGCYTVTTEGSGATNWVLTRATDYDEPAEILPGDLFPILNGTDNGGSSWFQTRPVSTVGTDDIFFVINSINPNRIVTIDTTQTITGDKTFTGTVEVPTPSTDDEAANKSYVDGQVVAANRPGEFFWFCAATPPSYALECNGAAVSRTTYSNLFSVIGTTFGAGDGSTTFNVPDVQTGNRFVRAGTVGTTQTHQLESHSHTFDIDRNTRTMNTTGPVVDAVRYTNRQTATSGTTGNFGTETRPNNIALLPCIVF